MSGISGHSADMLVSQWAALYRCHESTFSQLGGYPDMTLGVPPVQPDTSSNSVEVSRAMYIGAIPSLCVKHV